MTATGSHRRRQAPGAASAATTNHQNGQPEAAVPYRPGIRRRWMLRRQGRRDGSRRQPDPLLLTGPVTTTMRRLLVEEYAAAAAAVKNALTEQTAPLMDAWARHDAVIRRMRVDLPAAEQRLAEVLASRPGPDAPLERRLGEERRPEALVRARRLREHERAVEAARRERWLLCDERSAAEQERARLRVGVERAHQRAVDQVHRLRASYQRDLAIYDQALLRRHPDGELLRDLLVTRDLLPPEWTCQPAEPLPSGA